MQSVLDIIMCIFDSFSYFLDMLSKVDKNTTEVELKQDGSYDVVGIDDEVCLSDDDEDVKPMMAGSSSAGPSNGSDQHNGGKKKKAASAVADEDIIVLSDDDDDEEQLNRGILMSLNDFAANAANQLNAAGGWTRMLVMIVVCAREMLAKISKKKSIFLSW